MVNNEIFNVGFDEENNKYTVNVKQGSSPNEVAFAMSVVIRCFVRDKVVENEDTMIELIKKYTSDPQYKEVENNG